MESDPLQPQLEAAQKTLEMALEEACGVDLRDVDTGEMIRIEETLSIATEAAKEAVSMRLRRKSRVKRQSDPAVESSRSSDRVFDDIRGKRWHAYEVHPSTATIQAGGLPDSFVGGWLAFESRDEKRRIAPIPKDWWELATNDLRQLCHDAEPSGKRLSDPGGRAD